MKSSANADLIPIVLYCIGIFQPIRETELIEVVKLFARKLGKSEYDEGIKDAIKTVRDANQVWHLGNHFFSLTALGQDSLRRLKIAKVRDKERLLHLRRLAK